MYITREIADRIKLRLKNQDVNTKDMLSDLDMGINAISEFAKGKQMSCISLARIADYLDCSVDYLLGRTDVPAASRSDTSPANLTFDEQSLVSAYRQQPEMQAAVKKLLGIDTTGMSPNTPKRKECNL